jgi:hypothetical protein
MVNGYTYFVFIGYSLCSLGIFVFIGYLYFVTIWYIFRRFGIFYPEKSGNPGQLSAVQNRRPDAATVRQTGSHLLLRQNPAKKTCKKIATVFWGLTIKANEKKLLILASTDSQQSLCGQSLSVRHSHLTLSLSGKS